MARHRGLPDPLAGTGDGDRRERERLEGGRVEAEVGPDVRQAGGEHAARQGKALDRAEHGLVGEVDDDVRREARERRLYVLDERHAVLLPAAQLLRTADEDGRDDVVRKLGQRVPDDGRIVLAVDDRERPHVLAVTSSSIAPVNFAYSSVSSENETSFSSPWKGCRRQMSTLRPAISMTL